MSCSINAFNISAKIGDKILFKNLNLNAKHKEKIVIIGPNGAGKTTLLEILAGLKMPQTGCIELFHNKISSLEDFKAFRPQIGYLFQNSDEQFICPNVYDDVAFSLRALESKNIEEKVEQILKELEIWDLKDEIVFNLSGGQKKLVALAGVLVFEPKIMLLDEPTAGIDFKMQEKLIEILSNLDITLIMVSHDEKFIDKISTNIYYLDETGLKQKDLESF